MKNTIRIGTRNSPLAFLQAKKVQYELSKLGKVSFLVPIKSYGDLEYNIPIKKINSIGLFTKTLIRAMIIGLVDISVHSLKDIPTTLLKNVILSACLKRENVLDILVYKGSDSFLYNPSIPALIATGSIRRKAFWKNRYPYHTIIDLRGNINTRLNKLIKNNWNGAIFSISALERLNILNNLKNFNLKYTILEWMIPSPAQGVIAITSLKKNKNLSIYCKKLDHKKTRYAITIERQFLGTLEGGCYTPIGAYAFFKKKIVHFHGALLSKNGIKKIEKYKITSNFKKLGGGCAKDILYNNSINFYKKN
jgi:hydroxymethylbilane synthase